MRSAKILRGLSLVGAGLLIVGAVSVAIAGTFFPTDPPASVLPPSPTSLWDVSLVNSLEFLRPQFPGLRTSADGRVAIEAKVNAELRLSLITPEAIGVPFLQSSPGVTITTAANTKRYPAAVLHASTLPQPAVTHAAILDPGGLTSGVPVNPYVTGANDAYDVKIVAFVHDNTTKLAPVEAWVTPVHVEVSSPKTASAALVTVSFQAPSLALTYATANVVFEPRITTDGRLLVFRVSGSPITWTNNAGLSVTGKYDIVYSYNATSAPGDVSAWSSIYPITHAPFDARLKGVYGFADAPFRDPQNVAIPDGVDLPATYPWIDSRGRNVFFHMIDATNYFWDSSLHAIRTRYETTGVLANATWPRTQADLATGDWEVEGNTRGLSVVGRWTNGKIVLLDEILDNVDYGTRILDIDQTMLRLYSNASIRTGTGRETVGPFPPLASANSTIVDSTENFLVATPSMTPRTPRDIVWLVNNGKASGEVAFDDYIDRSVFIDAPMNVSLSVTATSATSASCTVFDGFRNDGKSPAAFDQQVLLQNAATSPTWLIPAAGTVHGTGRVEPVHLGGVHGKGFYVFPGSRVEFPFPAQPQDPASSPWYASVFLNPSFGNDGVARELLSFADGSSVAIVGTRTVELVDAAGSVVASFALGSLGLARGTWTHLAFLVEQAGAQVTVVVDGMRYASWNAGTGSMRLLQIPASAPGTITLGGRAGATGITGWVDDFKVMAELPTDELLANHARGTIVQLQKSYIGPLRTRANAYPSATQARIRAALGQTDPSVLYACFTAYGTELGASHREVPAGTTSVRAALDFPEQGTATEPRPSSLANAFCLSCHGAPRAPSSSLTTLALQPGQGVNEDVDPIRRPLQPPSRLFGNVPAGFFGPGLPATTVSSPLGIVVDDYLIK